MYFMHGKDVTFVVVGCGHSFVKTTILMNEVHFIIRRLKSSLPRLRVPASELVLRCEVLLRPNHICAIADSGAFRSGTIGVSCEGRGFFDWSGR